MGEGSVASGAMQVQEKRAEKLAEEIGVQGMSGRKWRKHCRVPLCASITVINQILDKRMTGS